MTTTAAPRVPINPKGTCPWAMPLVNGKLYTIVTPERYNKSVEKWLCGQKEKGFESFSTDLPYLVGLAENRQLARHGLLVPRGESQKSFAMAREAYRQIGHLEDDIFAIASEYPDHGLDSFSVSLERHLVAPPFLLCKPIEFHHIALDHLAKRLKGQFQIAIGSGLNPTWRILTVNHGPRSIT